MGAIGPMGKNLVLQLGPASPLEATNEGNSVCHPAKGTLPAAFFMVLLLLEWTWQDATLLWA